MELSIDSSTRYASVAVSRRGVVVTERTWRAERNHSVELTPAIRSIMEEATVAPPDLNAVFVARGPGGFSSLRVGMATAKAMAMGLDVPLVAVGTLDIEMAPYLPSEPPVCAIVEGGRGRLYARWSKSDTKDLAVLTVDELTERTVEHTVFCGEATIAMAKILVAQLGDLADVRAVAPPTRRAGTLAALGFVRLEAGEVDDPDVLEPLYMRSAQYEVARKTHVG